MGSLVIALCFFATCCEDLVSPIRPKTYLEAPAVIAAAPYILSGRPPRRLNLWKFCLPHPRRLDYLAQSQAGIDNQLGRKADPRYLGLPVGDEAFVLVDSPRGKPNVGDVLWVNYFTNGPVYRADTAALDVVWHEGRERAYVVFALCGMEKVSLWVEEVDVKKKPVARHPLPFDNHRRTEWPRSTFRWWGDAPHFEKVFTDQALSSSDFFYSVARVRVTVEKDSLLVVAEREDLKCPALCFRYHLDKKLWCEVRLKEVLDPAKKD